MIELNDDAIFYSFDRDLQPVLTVASGETVRIRTKDCFGNQVQRPEDELDSIDWDRINPATGPVFVEGAVAGGALKVKIEDIELDGQIACCTGEGEGVCGDMFNAWSTRVLPIEDGAVRPDDRRHRRGSCRRARELRNARSPRRQYGQHRHRSRCHVVFPRFG